MGRSVWNRRLMPAMTVCLWGAAIAAPTAGVGQEVAPLPTNQPVWMVGNTGIDGGHLEPYTDVRFSMGAWDKADGPIAVGERIEAQVYSVMSLQPERRAGRDVWVRSFKRLRVGDPTPLATGEIVLDRRTLAPISSQVERGDAPAAGFKYDWDAHEVRATGPEGAVESMDLMSLEAAAHETWVAAIDWREGMRVMIPTILAGGGGKWWAVPRVIGSEDVDLGDGVLRSTWVVEMDWWGMGSDHETFTPGGGTNGSAGPGGKYWVLKDAPAGVPRVVRIQTEGNAERDRVEQLQDQVATAR